MGAMTKLSEDKKLGFVAAGACISFIALAALWLVEALGKGRGR